MAGRIEPLEELPPEAYDYDDGRRRRYLIENDCEYRCAVTYCDADGCSPRYWRCVEKCIEQ